MAPQVNIYNLYTNKSFRGEFLVTFPSVIDLGTCTAYTLEFTLLYTILKDHGMFGKYSSVPCYLLRVVE